MIYNYKGKIYPGYLKTGDAQKYIATVAMHFCKGKGVDVGGYMNWTLKGSTAINVTNDDGYHADDFPGEDLDYIFSSHTLEHIPDYISTLEYWTTKLKNVGIIYLYLPHYDMEYWRPENNRKHLHSFTPEVITNALTELGYKNIIASERDMYYSFSVVGRKYETD